MDETTIEKKPVTSTAQPAEGVAAPSPRRWAIMAVLGAVAFMAQLDMFIVNIAIPAIGHSFPGTALGTMSWILNAYTIVFAALLVPAGRLADQFGRRRFLLIGVVIFTLASALCAAAPNLGVVIAGRALQGIGAAMVVPTSLGLLYPSFPKHEHGKVVGIWAGVAAVAGASGPTVGGLLVNLDWRLIFLINVPIGVATLIAGRIVLPEIRAPRGSKLPDIVSGAAIFIAVAALTLATVQSSEWGWTGASTLALLVLTVIAAVVSVWRSISHPHALIESTLFRVRAFSAASLGLFLFFLAFSAWLLITGLFLQDVWHYSALRTGLAIVPGPLAAAAFALNSGRIINRFGRRTAAFSGALLFATAGVLWLFGGTQHPNYLLGMLPGFIIGGSGAGLLQAPLFGVASMLPPERATTGSAVLNMARQVGSTIGVAILVTLLGVAHPDKASLYRPGWIFITVACLASAAAVLRIKQKAIQKTS
ncbi:Multidrug resistance protein Stp [Streptomyces sp. RB17]|uniref:MFS transporter n=1 Tax=Streptomyces sp. RB17 TaxID=2585197 RepID=UPI0012976343|nr:MFS transporter [Streptomyces sp. RB17]MQY40641.1 Multidrug resistance protein Stp [Streptomyces sp. RB17]